tara:strand:- start:2685 stop:2906 length:222 start_codon:yes stop_codon:yes gene_type:complete
MIADNLPTDIRITELLLPPNGNPIIVEYQHNSHFAVFEYAGAEGSRKATHEYCDEEQYDLQGIMQQILSENYM